MRTIHIPGIGNTAIGTAIGRIVGAIASLITLIGVIITAITGSSDGTSPTTDVPTASPTTTPTSTTAAEPSTTAATTSTSSAKPTSAKPSPQPTTPTSTPRPAPPTPTTSTPPRSEAAPTPTRPAAPTTSTSRRDESDYGPGEARSWREWFSLDYTQMRHNAGQLGRNMGKFLRQGGGVPLDELTTFAGGQADSFREITFNESGPDADLYAFTEYVEESGPGPTVVHVERISIPLAMISEDNPWLWGALKAPDHKGLNYGTAVRFDDNYFYVFTALRKVS